MSLTSSYEFHCTLESPRAFVRREWQAIAAFGGGFAAIFLFAIFSVSPAYYYPRLRTDSLGYYLKGLAFVQTGSTTARSAINTNPFTYVSMPGVLRSPLMLAFSDFDSQLRAIQVSNILLVGLTAIMYAYVVSWIVPRKWHWLAIGVSFGFMLLNPEWAANVFTLLADAPYAAATIAFLILATKVLCSPRPLREQRLAIAAGIILFAVAFLTRFIAPVLLVYAGVLAMGRRKSHPVSPVNLVVAATAATLIIGILLVFNWHTIVGRYLIQPWYFLLRAEKRSVMMNLLASAIPSQIIPDFQLGFAQDPLVDTYHVRFGNSVRDLVLVTTGLAISATMFFGMWRSRNRFAPEIAYVVAALPVLALMIPSTGRYLIAYEPLFWIFFYSGASVLLTPIARRMGTGPRAAVIGFALMLFTGVGVVYLRSRIAHAPGSETGKLAIGETRGYASEVSSTYGALRRFLDGLPRSRTLLIDATGRWKVISGLDYYRPDSGLVVAVRNRDVYLVVDCANQGDCYRFAAQEAQYKKRLAKYGSFSLEPVFSRATEHARARIYRISNNP